MTQNDTAPVMPFSVERSDGTIPDLAGATVDFIMQAPSGTVTNTGHTACTVTDIAGGLGYYDFQTDDLAEDGDYTCDLQITYANSKIETGLKPIEINARPEAG